jgi:hypothetical protein
MQSIREQRRDQMFPKLDPVEIERVGRFGEVRSFAAGESLGIIGQITPGLVVILSGKGQTVHQRNKPARTYRNEVKLATRIFSANAVGRMTEGAIPNRAIRAM